MSEIANTVAKLLSLVPGYSGYAGREKCRESDQALRRAIVGLLGEARPGIDRQIGAAAGAMAFDLLEPLAGLRQRTDILCDTIRHAPAGYSALFASVRIDENILEELHQADLALHTWAAEARVRLDSLSFRTPASIDAAAEALGWLETGMRRRGEILERAA